MNPLIINTAAALVVESSRRGGFIDLTTAAAVADLSRSRVQHLIAAGRVRAFVVYGKACVSVADWAAWSSGERRPGRPRKTS